MKTSHNGLAVFAAISAMALLSLPGVLAQAPAGASGGRGGGRGGSGGGGNKGSIDSWVFKPAKAGIFTAPNKPVWHLKDILAAHAGKADWAETVVKDDDFTIQYISLAPGTSTRTSFEIDTKIWFIMKGGQARFTIKGIDPFIAKRDFIVQVPMRTPYKIETVGDAPSLRLEVRESRDSVGYPLADNPTAPTPPEGYIAVKAHVGGSPQPYSDTMKPYLDFDTDYVNATTPPARTGFFVSDARGFATPIRGKGQPDQPTTNIGHFHTGLAEFWLVLEGECDVLIEGVPDLVKGYDGDVLYSPRGSFHRTNLAGPGMSTRLAMGGITDSGSAITYIDGN
jgi:mannose-6-phosphate isomerase-like protein (cupin superfamily)